MHDEGTARRAPRRLGIVGWLRGGRRGLEGYLYVLHRLSGLALLGFLCLHVLVTASRLLGEETWARVMASTDVPALRFLEYMVFAAFAFHALNGVRLVLVELGIGLGRPIEPVYPYKTCLGVQRPLSIVMMVLAALLILAGGLDFFVLH